LTNRAAFVTMATMAAPEDLLAESPTEVSVYEVGLRDGLQNEPQVVSTEQKVELARALVASGLRRIEATSFVSPKWVPQLADASELLGALASFERVGGPTRWSALVPNERGLERAAAAKLEEVAVFLSASEAHNKANINKSIDATLDLFRELVPLALSLGMRVRAYVSTVWGCPYEGPVAIERSVKIAEQLHAFGAYQVSLGDTIGVGTPRQTMNIVRAMRASLPVEALALHFHDTRGTALANVLMGLECGIRTFDASIAGLGGCPYAPGASGNLATEDLVYMLDGMGVSTGVDLEELVAAGQVAARVLGRKLLGKVHQAGPFKRRPFPA
jgi:hydroxymethylglutaryl-CoA lyase